MFFAPVHLALFLLVLLLAAVLFVRIRRARMPSAPSCGACGYAVPHDEAQVCPECGGRYTLVGLRSPVYNPLAVWARASSRGVVFVSIPALLTIAAAFIVFAVAGPHSSRQHKSWIEFWYYRDSAGVESAASGVGGSLWRADVRVDATGPEDGPADEAVILLELKPSPPMKALALTIDAARGHFQIHSDDVVTASGEYQEEHTLNAFLAQAQYPQDAELQTMLKDHIANVYRTTQTQLSWFSARSVEPWLNSRRPRQLFKITSGNSGISLASPPGAPLFVVLVCGLVLLLLAVAFWAWNCRILLRADKISREKLIAECDT